MSLRSKILLKCHDCYILKEHIVGTSASTNKCKVFSCECDEGTSIAYKWTAYKLLRLLPNCVRIFAFNFIL